LWRFCSFGHCWMIHEPLPHMNSMLTGKFVRTECQGLSSRIVIVMPVLPDWILGSHQLRVLGVRWSCRGTQGELLEEFLSLERIHYTTMSPYLHCQNQILILRQGF
jgi:hypothetical protein